MENMYSTGQLLEELLTCPQLFSFSLPLELSKTATSFIGDVYYNALSVSDRIGSLLCTHSASECFHVKRIEAESLPSRVLVLHENVSCKTPC